MAKERIQVVPPVDLSSGEAVARFVVDLNTKLDKVSQRLPADASKQLKVLRSDLASLSAQKNPSIAIPNANPVDVNALKGDLEQHILPSIQAALDAHTESVRSIVEALTTVVDSLLN
jgi:hypothetical protein